MGHCRPLFLYCHLFNCCLISRFEPWSLVSEKTGLPTAPQPMTMSKFRLFYKTMYSFFNFRFAVHLYIHDRHRSGEPTNGICRPDHRSDSQRYQRNSDVESWRHDLRWWRRRRLRRLWRRRRERQKWRQTGRNFVVGCFGKGAGTNTIELLLP